MPTSAPESFEFQAEVKQILDIVIHSLYTEKEIFVRELVSNASDSLEKLRHIQLTEKDIFDDKLALEINITTDDKAKTLTIQDFGVGMTRAELIENLGTIAHSGSKAFLKALGESGQKSGKLIGQFGVGFYAAFMVAKSVRVFAHSWKPGEPGHLWTSNGGGEYSIEESAGERRGAKIVVELKEDCSEFSQEWRIKEILQQYSAFVTFPINLNGKKINTVQALWSRNKSEITDDEYVEFYKFQAHSVDDPRLRLHFNADAPLSINALLFVPKDNPEKLGMVRTEPAVALYSRKVLIDPHPKNLLPEWLRFLKGVVDSEDLPLNISRETMQDRSLLEKLSRVITKRFLRFLEEEAKSRPDSFDGFHKEFGVFLKEGAVMDFTHKDQIVKLLRFESSLTEGGKMTSLSDYVSRMPGGQTQIYYILGPNRSAIEAGPYIEGFKVRNLEVLYCFDGVDEYVMDTVHEFDGKTLAAADRADVKLPELPAQTDGALGEEDTKRLVAFLKDTLGERVADIKVSERLVDSPVLALSADKLASSHMRRVMKALNKDGAESPVRVNLEINPRHALIKRLAVSAVSTPEKARLVAEQVLDNALISAGLLEDPAKMVQRLYKILEDV